jgi:hypothetical protein
MDSAGMKIGGVLEQTMALIEQKIRRTRGEVTKAESTMKTELQQHGLSPKSAKVSRITSSSWTETMIPL